MQIEQTDLFDRVIYDGRRATSGVCHGALTLLIEKFSGDGTPTTVGEGSVGVEPRTREYGEFDNDACIALELDGETSLLTRSAAVELRAALSAGLSERREFVHTTGEHRADGSYVVSRRGASSSGHRKVFETFRMVGRLYDDLPTEFAAIDLARPGLSGGRRHLLVRHLAEHPGFECTLVSQQPLTARKWRENG